MTSDNPVLQEVGDGVYAYLQRSGWGFSNAGLVADAGTSLLVDTQYDLGLTRRMLDVMRSATPAARHIATVVNTHANGDHCWGNAAIDGAKIVSTRSAALEMGELSPRLMATLVGAARIMARSGPGARRLWSLLRRVGVSRAASLSEAADFVVDAFGAFDFGGVSLRLPTDTFDGRLTMKVGGKTLELIEVGPAHTKGDAIVYLPRERVAFSGDILFIGSHPIIWEGPVQNWIAACDRLLALDVDVIVPGHGPLTDHAGVARTKAYWETLVDVSTRGLAAGATPDAIAAELAAQAFDGWTERSRLAVNIDTICRELAGQRSERDPLALLAKMARLERSPSI